MTSSSTFGQAASYSSECSTGSRPRSRSTSSAMMSGFPPSTMSVPRPAMLVATVTAPFRPALAMINASRWCCLALSTSCGTLRLTSAFDRNSDFSTLVVPTRTGWPFSWRSAMSSATASNFAGSLL